MAIIGGGIVGLATAYELTRRQDCRVTLLEKEPDLAAHQSGRNSGVLHSGIYYAPGSSQAANCMAGRRRMIDFCRTEGVPYEVCGKVIVASSEDEQQRLQVLRARGKANGVTCELISGEALREREPHAAGIGALWVKDAGIIDFAHATRKMAARGKERGLQVWTGAKVIGARTEAGFVTLESTAGEVRARQILNCTGLHADRMARLLGQEPEIRIVPFRGEYYTLGKRHLCRHLIYPAGNPQLPFLGIHVTRMIDGSVLCGPSAVLALAREGYKPGTLCPRDVVGLLTWPGTWHLARSYWKTGMREFLQSASKRFYLRAVRQLIPEIDPDDLVPARSGVRAQGLTRKGKLLTDMHILESSATVSVLSTTSPTATGSLAIGEALATLMASRLK